MDFDKLNLDELDYGCGTFIRNFKNASDIDAIKKLFKHHHDRNKYHLVFYISFRTALNVLFNHYYEQGNMEYARLYNELEKKAEDFINFRLENWGHKGFSLENVEKYERENIFC